MGHLKSKKLSCCCDSQ